MVSVIDLTACYFGILCISALFLMLEEYKNTNYSAGLK